LCSYSDYFDLKKNKSLGSWNIEKETMVVRYCNCNLKCPICYAAGPSYLHYLIGSKKPVSTKSNSYPIYLKYSCCAEWKLPLNLLRRKRYVRIQGGEPLLNSYRSKLTAKIIIDFLNMLRKYSIEKCVAVIQTNGCWLGYKEENAIDFLESLVNFAKDIGIDKKIKEGLYYRIAIEISYKAPNPDDFSIFSGTGIPSLWRNQVNAFWNLINLLERGFKEYNGIAVYPIAGFIMPIHEDCGIIPLNVYGKPLFHPDTWDDNFREIVKEFSRIVINKYNRYRPYWTLKSYWKNSNGDIIKLRGEELEMTYYQLHVPSIYFKYREFKEHFDKFKKYFLLYRAIKYKGMYKIYEKFKEIGLKEIDDKEFRKMRNEMIKNFYALESYKYYPFL